MQGCLLSKDECDGKSCNTLTLGKNSTPISNDAFQETIVSNSEHHPTSERNISTSLGRDIDAFDVKSIHELEVLGRLRLDICCYNDPRSNCNGISSHQPNRLSIPNCISTQGKDVLSFSTFRYKICLEFILVPCCIDSTLHFLNSISDISSLEEIKQKIFSSPSLRIGQDRVLHYVLIAFAFLIIMVVSILFLVR